MKKFGANSQFEPCINYKKIRYFLYCSLKLCINFPFLYFVEITRKFSKIEIQNKLDELNKYSILQFK